VFAGFFITEFFEVQSYSLCEIISKSVFNASQNLFCFYGFFSEKWVEIPDFSGIGFSPEKISRQTDRLVDNFPKKAASTTRNMNSKIGLKTVLFYFFLHLVFFFKVSGQQSHYYDDPKASFRMGLDLIEKKQFGAAQEVFGRLIEALPAGESVMLLEAEYHDALCDYYLNHPQAGEKFSKFVQHYPDHSKTNLAILHLGLIEYSQRKYKNALEYFGRVDPFRLSPEITPEYLYKTGYSYLQREDFSKAKEALFPILNTPSDYRNAANYYYASIAFLEKDYQKALLYFEKVDKTSAFAGEVSQYLIQINYVNKNYDQVILTGSKLIEGDIQDKKRAGELARIVAEAYYQKKDFANALIYFERYIKDTRRSPTREENYQLGYASYQTGDFKKATGFFEKSIKDKDELSQNAHYHLADCYLQTGQKNFARNAFYAAFQIQGNEDLREDALFNYAKLTFELAYDPFNSSLNALNQYIRDYPASDRIDEAYHYLTNLLLSSKDYQASVDAIEKLEIKNRDLQTAYQRLTLQYGIQLFNNGNYKTAADNFRKSLQTQINRELANRATFWLGETYYQSGDYPRAIDLYEKFMTSRGASKLDIYHLALYNLGYSYFKLKYYDNAISSFKNFVDRPGESEGKYIADALTRIGDSYFITKNYAQAVNYYHQAASHSSGNKNDYAHFQKALSQGAQGKSEEKITTLNNLLTKNPQSSYADDASYEIAETYLLLNDNIRALEWFDKITTLYPNSSYLQKAWQKKGMIYYNQNNLDQALEVLKQLVTNYPNTSESREALLTIRNIYMDKNDVSSYYTFAETVPFANITTSEQDSITYIAAENFYLNNDCQSAIDAFEKYIRKFENGAFILNANFYKAECEYQLQNYSEALTGYEYVINSPKSKFTESALARAGDICLNNKDLEKALGHFSTLETLADLPANVIKAISGQMECYFELGQYQKALEAAQKLQKHDRLGNEQIIRSHYIAGKSALFTDNYDLAETELKKTVDLSDDLHGAEAKYLLATVAFQQKEFSLAEDLVIGLSVEYPSFEYWKAMGFILLADVYSQNGNTFQAKQTLQSIIDNYPGEDLKEIAGQKLTTIIREEQENAEEPLQIEEEK